MEERCPSVTELERRRELTRLTKTELIDWIMQIESAHGQAEAATTALRQRIEEQP